MTIATLDVQDFRCIERGEMEFDQRCTLVIGDNAAGKTSLLEAIHFLSCGRSFRSGQSDLLIRSGQPYFQIVGRVSQQQNYVTLGVKVSSTDKEFHLGGVRARGYAEMAAVLPVQVIDPGAHKLLEDGPGRRRRFLDWGVFHVEPRFVDYWRRYQRALNQRNAALKAQQPANLVNSWDSELVACGEQIAELRRQYVLVLAPIVAEIAEELLSVSVSLIYRHGWDAQSTLAASLASSWGRDVRYRNTTVGPHRAELEIQIDGAMAKDRISRGQQKLLACALMLAQLRYRAELGKSNACLLLDDPAAELDVDNLKRLLTAVVKTPAQVVVTALTPSTVDVIAPRIKFHVKQGRTMQVL